MLHSVLLAVLISIPASSRDIAVHDSARRTCMRMRTHAEPMCVCVGGGGARAMQMCLAAGCHVALVAQGAGFTEPLEEGHVPLPTGCYYNQTTHATKPFSRLRCVSACAVHAFLGHLLDDPLNALNVFSPAARTKCRT